MPHEHVPEGQETLRPRRGSKVYERIREFLQPRIQLAEQAAEQNRDVWRRADERMQLWVPETERDAVRRARREGGQAEYTHILLPYTYGQVMTAHAYLAQVFLGRTPVFQFTTRSGSRGDEVLAIEALVDYQVTNGDMLPVLSAWLLDVVRYGLGIVEPYWAEEKLSVTGPDGTERIALRYMGHRLYNVAPADFLPDPRVPLFRFQEGEFCAVYGEHGLWELRALEAQGAVFGIQRLEDTAGRFRPRRRWSSTLDEATGAPRHPVEPLGGDPPDAVGVYRVVATVTPSRLGVASGSAPEKWVFWITADFEHVLLVRPLGLWHDRFPFAVAMLEPDAHASAVRGVPKLIEGVQDTVDWLVNSLHFNTRSLLYGSTIVVDPSKIVLRDLTDPPVPERRVVRLTPSAAMAGVRPADTYAQLNMPFVAGNNIPSIELMHQFAQRATGINDFLMGMLEPRGRRSATEVRTTTGGAVSRLKVVADFVSATGFIPLARQLVMTTQQLYTGEMQLRVAGDLLPGQTPTIVVTPDSIAGEFDLVPADGTLPVDRLAQANLWRELLAQAAQVPEIAQRFDLAKIFEWIAKLAGLRDLGAFARVEPVPPGGVPDGMVPVPPEEVLGTPGRRAGGAGGAAGVGEAAPGRLVGDGMGV